LLFARVQEERIFQAPVRCVAHLPCTVKYSFEELTILKPTCAEFLTNAHTHGTHTCIHTHTCTHTHTHAHTHTHIHTHTHTHTITHTHTHAHTHTFTHTHTHAHTHSRRYRSTISHQIYLLLSPTKDGSFGRVEVAEELQFAADQPQ